MTFWKEERKLLTTNVQHLLLVLRTERKNNSKGKNYYAKFLLICKGNFHSFVAGGKTPAKAKNSKGKNYYAKFLLIYKGNFHSFVAGGKTPAKAKIPRFNRAIKKITVIKNHTPKNP